MERTYLLVYQTLRAISWQNQEIDKQTRAIEEIASQIGETFSRIGETDPRIDKAFMMSNELSVNSNEATLKTRIIEGFIIDTDTANIIRLMGVQSNSTYI